jgi:rubrerythrin
MSTSTQAARDFLGKLLSKAVQTEELAAAHYRRIASIAPDEALERRALQDARTEARHAEALRRAALRDGIVLRETQGWDEDFDGVRAAFDRCATRGDVVACLFVQDVFLEVISITFYEILAQTAWRVGADAIAAVVEKAIIPDERLHLAHGLRDIRERVPEPGPRAEAFRQAAAEIVPAMRVFGDMTATQPCARTCRTCSDHCLKVDACCGEVSLEGTWQRVLDGVTQAVQAMGIGLAAA